MTAEKDSAGQDFFDVPTLEGENVRVTFISGDRAGYRVDSVRIQIRDETGHLRQGPEVPIQSIPELIRAIVDLVRKD